jgi:hypothetical protein
MSEYDRSKDKQLFKEGVNVHKQRGERYINVVAYQYDGGEKKIRIQLSNKNTNPNADSNKQWINQKGISSITKDEAKGLIKLLEKALYKLD